MRYEIIKGVAEFKVNLARYRDFLTSCETVHYQQYPEYILSLVEENKDNQLIIIFIENNGHLSLVAPFIQAKSQHKIKFSLFSVWTTSVNKLRLLGSNFIHKKMGNNDALYAEVFKLVSHFKFDIFELHADSQSSLTNYLTKCPLSLPNKMQFKAITQQEQYQVFYEGTFEDFLKSLSRNNYRNIIKAQKRITTEFKDIELIQIENEEDVDFFYAKMLEIFKSSWKRHFFSPTPIHEVYRMAKLNWLRAYLYVVNGEAIAFKYTIQPDNKLLVFIDTAYKTSWEKYAPGKVLLYNIMSVLYKNKGPIACDFGTGANNLKLTFSNRILTTTTFYFYKNRSYCSFLANLEICLHKIYLMTSNVLERLHLDKFIRKFIKKP